jgi:hypothetical protein
MQNNIVVHGNREMSWHFVVFRIWEFEMNFLNFSDGKAMMQDTSWFKKGEL